jgi:hypothetical protein
VTVAIAVGDPDLRCLFDYWCGLRRGRLMPARSDIDPLDIVWALSRIFLLDYDPAGGLVYRLAGGEIAGMFGRGNLKGLRPRDFLPPDRAATVEKIFMRVIEDRCVMHMRGLIYLRADRLPLGERLFLPLADGGADTVTGVLGMTVVHSEIADMPVAVLHADPQYLPVSDIP